MTVTLIPDVPTRLWAIRSHDGRGLWYADASDEEHDTIVTFLRREDAEDVLQLLGWTHGRIIDLSSLMDVGTCLPDYELRWRCSQMLLGWVAAVVAGCSLLGMHWALVPEPQRLSTVRVVVALGLQSVLLSTLFYYGQYFYRRWRYARRVVAELKSRA